MPTRGLLFEDASINKSSRPLAAAANNRYILKLSAKDMDPAALNALARDSLNSLAKRGFVKPDFIQQLLDVRLAEHPGYYGEMIWILMMLEQWLRKHAPGYSVPT